MDIIQRARFQGDRTLKQQIKAKNKWFNRLSKQDIDVEYRPQVVFDDSRFKVGYDRINHYKEVKALIDSYVHRKVGNEPAVHVESDSST